MLIGIMEKPGVRIEIPADNATILKEKIAEIIENDSEFKFIKFVVR